MYLKALDIVGFKSFAEKTKLNFEPGMTCIVGPNGCGKSNVSDAIRWVLGEQSAKALRGGKMQDVIFAGTETHKPLSLAEVSLTLSDCTQALGMEYDEVTITRRVLRSGEGQYFINKTSCRLKDIQRLFMDTGVGTNSYSVMEQGKIDQILSSRPEDRRAIFEEASGITRYKADRKEAMRKLDQTEANLLRLEDIVREVKRQIGSLQRQAGKARRYKTMQDELRGLDIFATRERIKKLDQELKGLGNQVTSLKEQDEAATADLEKTEVRLEELREGLSGLESSINLGMETNSEIQSRHDRTAQSVQMNRERIEEYQQHLQRDSQDAEEGRRRLEQHHEHLKTYLHTLETENQRVGEIQIDHDRENKILQNLEQDVDRTRHELNDFRSRAVDTDSRIARLQNELADMDAREQSNNLLRERLSAEKGQMERSVQLFTEQQSGLQQELDQRKEAVQHCREALELLEKERTGRRASMDELSAEQRKIEQTLASLRTRLELLQQAEAAAEGFGSGARHLLQNEADSLSGTIADALETDPEYAGALQAVLSSVLDALIVEDQETGIRLMQTVLAGSHGAVRLQIRPGETRPCSQAVEGLTSLRTQIRPAPGAEGLADLLLANCYLIDSLDQLPSPLPEGSCFVTREGLIARADGLLAVWAQEGAETNPLARRQQMDSLLKEKTKLDKELERILSQTEQLRDEGKSLDERMQEARAALQNAQAKRSQKEGEGQIIQREARDAAKRLETVSYELNTLIEQTSEGTGKRENLVARIEEKRQEISQIRGQIQSHTDALRGLEENRSNQLRESSELRVRLSEAKGRMSQMQHQVEGQQSRIQEVQDLIENRSRDANQTTTRIQTLKEQIETAQTALPALQEELKTAQTQLQALRERRSNASAELHTLENELRGKRQHADQIRTQCNQLQIQQTEKSTRRQTSFERLASDYNVSLEDIMQASEPEWEEGRRPDRETLETRIAELKTKLEAMGPVNLVAIEEHQELEERYAFLTQQQADLIDAKKQLEDMIRKINRTTTELFKQTFDQVNENFKVTFEKVFGGGTAKLVLVDEDDVLETGIEIIARPPGKKLQTVSLLSGGERTMTAVALLFALFMVKPSPFCVLDEIDAALDEANIGRFVKMVEEFLVQSQFIVITHSQKTIAAGNVLYGVTMQTRGISKIVSVKFSERDPIEPVDAKS